MHTAANGQGLPKCRQITFGSVCSGMEAVSEAVRPLGWNPLYFSEIEDAPVAVLKHRHRAHDLRAGRAPAGTVPLWGDFTSLRARHMRRFAIEMPDVLVGGTPCQSFSIAGKRLSMGDARGNLTLAFVRHAHAVDFLRARAGKPGLVVLWENVPGVLSTDDNAFGCVLGGFVGSDSPVVSPLERGRWPRQGMVAGPLARAAWRILDAQYFGVAQRRERVFLVVSLRNGPDPAAILFERCRVRGNPAPRREARKDVAPTLSARTRGGGGLGTDFEVDGGLIPEVARGLKSADMGHRHDPSTDNYIPEVAWALQERDAKGTDSSTKDGHLIVEPHSIGLGSDPLYAEGLAQPITGRKGDPGCIAFDCKASGSYGFGVSEEIASTVRSMSHDKGNVSGGGQLAVAFKPSHFTRGKDGRPSETAPPLSADADKGDQDTLVFKPNYFTREDGRSGAPSDLVAPLLGGRSGGDQAQVVLAFEPRTRGDDGRGYDRSPNIMEDVSPTVNTTKEPVVFQTRIARNGRGQPEDIVPALNDADAGATSDMRPVLAMGSSVRRLTPRECERLQGFPDDYSLVPYRSGLMADSPRYRMLGNSMAVPVIRWLAVRIQRALLGERIAA